MAGPLEEIHRQLEGFLKAGRVLEPPRDRADAALSRLAGLLLVAGAGALYGWLWSQTRLPARIHLRSLTMLAPLGVLVWALLRGVSVRSGLEAARRFWIPVLALSYLWVVVVYLGYGMLSGFSELTLGVSGGLLLGALALVVGGGSWAEARALRRRADGSLAPLGELPAAARARLAGLTLFALVWVVFFAAGLGMIAWGTGLADWFFRDVLRW